MTSTMAIGRIPAEDHPFRDAETDALLRHSLALFCLLFFFLRRRIHIHKEQQKQYGDKKNRGERVHLRLDSLADFGINLCGERINARSLGEVGDNEIIEGHRKGEQKARNNRPA